MLRVRGLSGGYGRAPVLDGVSLDVGGGEVVAILGRNGTGKTSLLRALVGLLPWSSGQVTFDGHELGRLPTHRRCRLGIGYVPQGRDVFAGLTVEDNLRFGHVLAGRPMRAPLPDELFESFPWMAERRSQPGRTLSGGQQQMLAIARVLVARPRLLLLDEPTEGLAPAVVEQLAALLGEVRRERELAILLVEQNVAFALSLAGRGYMIEKGRIVSEGDAEALRAEEVIGRHLAI
jgi:urea transport system ATP-binding protein